MMKALVVLLLLVLRCSAGPEGAPETQVDESECEVDTDVFVCIGTETECNDAVEEEETACTDGATTKDGESKSVLTDDGNGNSAKKSKKRKRFRTWKSVGGQSTESFCKENRAIIDRGGGERVELFSCGYKIYPPDPVYNSAMDYSKGAFCVPAVGFWVPDLIWPKYVSAMPCPYCGSSECVKPTKWAGVPRFVFGLFKNWLLDTKVYRCSRCAKTFRGTHPDSIALCPDIVRACFEIFIGPRYAADTQLAAYTLEHFSTRGTAGCVTTVRRWHAEEYYHNMLKHYAFLVTVKSCGAPANRPTKRARTVGHMDRFLVDRGSDVTLGQSLSALDSGAVAETPSDIAVSWSDALEKLPGIGISKANKLRENGIQDIQALAELLQTHDDAVLRTPTLEEARRCVGVEDHHAQRAVQTLLNWARKAVKYMTENYPNQDESDSESSSTSQYEDDWEPMHLDECEQIQLADIVAPLPEDFPTFQEWNGGHLLTESIADSIALSYAQHNAHHYKTQLCALTGTVLCFDQTFNVAKKISAYDPDTKTRYRPVQSMGNCMNEFGQIIWYAFLHQSENFEEYKSDLEEIRDRCDDIKCIYIDNCCTQRRQFQEVFGQNVPICLDCWHWFPRWDECIAVETTHPLNYKFRAMLRRSLITVDADDFAETTEALKKKGKHNPKYREVAQSCRNYILGPAQTMPAVRNTINYWVQRDILKNTRKAELQTKKNMRVITAKEHTELNNIVILFKPEKIQSVVTKQLSHICRRSTTKVSMKNKNGGTYWKTVHDYSHVCDDGCLAHSCLADPTGVNMNSKYPQYKEFLTGSNKRKRAEGALYRKRGTSQLENAHKQMRAVNGNAAQGPERAHAKMGRMVHRWNYDRGVDHRGDPDYGTDELITLAMCNGCAQKANCALPFPELKFATRENSRAKIGMEHISPIFQPAADALGGTTANARPQRTAGSTAGSSAGNSGNAAGAYVAPVVTAAVTAAALLTPAAKMARDLKAKGFVEEKVEGCGRCQFRCFAADDPNRPAQFSREQVKHGKGPDVVNYLIQYRKECAQHMERIWNGEIHWRDGQFLTAEEKTVLVEMVQKQYLIWENLEGGPVNVEQTFTSWYMHMMIDDSATNYVIWGDTLSAVARAHRDRIRLSLTSHTGQVVPQGDHPKFSYFAHGLWVPAESTRSLHLLNIGNKHYNILNSIPGDPSEATDVAAANVSEDTAGAIDDVAAANNSEGTADLGPECCLSERELEIFGPLTPDDMGIEGFSLEHKLFKKQTSFQFLGKVSGLDRIYPTPFPEEIKGNKKNDEMALFESMHPTYDIRITAPKHSNSYAAFAADWNATVLAETSKMMRGETHRVLKLKTPEQLREHYKRSVVTLGAAPRTDAEDESQKKVWSHLKRLRPSGQPAADVPHVQHVAPPDGGKSAQPAIPRAAPTFTGAGSRFNTVVLNTNGTAAVPYVQRKVGESTRLPKGVSVDGRSLCSGCGAPRSQVVHKRGRLGPKCQLPCFHCGEPQADHPDWMRPPICDGRWLNDKYI